MAAINAAGYDAEIGSPLNSPVREMVRRAVAARNPACLPELRTFFATHKQPDATSELRQYVSYALSVEDPPGFAYRYRTNELAPDVVALDGFDNLLRTFYKEADIESLWRQAQPAFEQVIARYHKPAMDALNQVNAYLRASVSVGRGARFQVFVDLLGAPNQIQMRSFRNDYFVVVTPSAEPKAVQIRHAYLHYWLDALSVRHAEALEKKKSLIDFAQPAPLLEAPYKSDFLLLATESLIKAIESRFAPEPARRELVDLALAEGHILTPAFAELLPAYEAQEQSMRFYFPELIKGVNLKKEDQRLQKVEFLKERPDAAPRPAEVTLVKPVLPPARRSLREAQQRYQLREFDKAQAAFERALKETEEAPLRAQAYYGLALLAGQREDMDAARQWFEKALGSSPDPETQSWSHVWLGRMAQVAGQREEAARRFQAALDTPGVPARARAAARQGLEDTPRRNPRL